LFLCTGYKYANLLFANKMVYDYKQRKRTKNLTNTHLHAKLIMLSDDEQAEHLARQNETVLGIIG